MGNYGVLWGCMGNSGELWGIMGNYGELWGCMGNYGVVWGCMLSSTSRSNSTTSRWTHKSIGSIGQLTKTFNINNRSSKIRCICFTVTSWYQL